MARESKKILFPVDLTPELGHSVVSWGKYSPNCLQKALEANESAAGANRFFFGNKGMGLFGGVNLGQNSAGLSRYYFQSRLGPNWAL